jgi:hypothetical protein
VADPYPPLLVQQGVAERRPSHQATRHQPGRKLFPQGGRPRSLGAHSGQGLNPALPGSQRHRPQETPGADHEGVDRAGGNGVDPARSQGQQDAGPRGNSEARGHRRVLPCRFPCTAVTRPRRGGRRRKLP